MLLVTSLLFSGNANQRRVLEKLEDVGEAAWYGAKAKLSRPGVSSGFVSHRLPLLSPFLHPESRGDDTHFGDHCIREG